MKRGAPAAPGRDVRLPRRRRIAPTALLALLGAAGVSIACGDPGDGARGDPTQALPVQQAAPPRGRPGRKVVRPPAVAGSFYPGEPEALYVAVERLLADRPPLGLRGVRAVLVPHAGYVYSGAIAAAAFREVDPGFRRVFVLAANHEGRASFSGPSIPDVTHYAIPGAEIPLDGAVDELLAHELFTTEPLAHRQHMIELELPFLHSLRGRPDPPDFTLVPMIVGRVPRPGAEALATVLERYADDPETLFVFSVDLSHFYTDEVARQLDQRSIDAVMSCDAQALERTVTDANHVLQTMVELALRKGWEPTFLASANSGDVSGDPSRVVGYAAIAFHEPLRLTEPEQAELLRLARDAIETHVRTDRVLDAGESWLEDHPIFRTSRAAFVTLMKEGRLRGCIGELTATRPLYLSVRDNAISAAVGDRRFPPVAEEELESLEISISILTHPSPVRVERPEEYLERLRPGVDGVILVIGDRRSTFLPHVWHDLPDPEEFLSRLSQKQSAAPDAWRGEGVRVFRYGAFVFGED